MSYPSLVLDDMGKAQTVIYVFSNPYPVFNVDRSLKAFPGTFYNTSSAKLKPPCPIPKTFIRNEGAIDPTDLSTCRSWLRLGTKGRLLRMALWHMDHHGVYTTVLCHTGLDLWPFQPHLSMNDLSAYSSTIPVSWYTCDQGTLW
jgi:hypothetical protein